MRFQTCCYYIFVVLFIFFGVGFVNPSFGQIPSSTTQGKTFIGATPTELIECLGPPSSHSFSNGQEFYIYVSQNGCRTAFIIKNHKIDHILYNTRYIKHLNGQPADVTQCPFFRQQCKVK